ncbi:hypothetical protein CDU01_11010 [Cronobacter sakazakii]|nr:hypothetical protein CDU01_11010 [Cronobacter sakazakii]
MTGFSHSASVVEISICRKKQAVLAADSDRQRSERGSAREMRLKKKEGRTGVAKDGFWRKCRRLQADRCQSVASVLAK